MQKNNSSLKSIAQKAGVSITTVHRALTGKKDCSDAMREKILKIAAEESFEFADVDHLGKVFVNNSSG